MNKLVSLLNLDPGGWPRFAKADFARSAAEVERRAKVIEANKTKHPVLVGVVTGFLVGFVPLTNGIEYALWTYLLYALPLLCYLPIAFLRPYLLNGLPADFACAWPKNLRLGRIRSYVGLMVSISSFWLMSCAVFVASCLMMRSGLADQWNPLTRTIHLPKNGLYSEYTFIDFVMIASGFFALTGLLWMPMYAFFEWLTAKADIAEMERGVNA